MRHGLVQPIAFAAPPVGPVTPTKLSTDSLDLRRQTIDGTRHVVNIGLHDSFVPQKVRRMSGLLPFLLPCSFSSTLSPYFVGKRHLLSSMRNTVLGLSKVFVRVLAAGTITMAAACEPGSSSNELDASITLAVDGSAPDPGSNDSGMSPERDAAPRPSSDGGTLGCGQSGAATGVQSFDTTIGGVSRHYQVVVPTTYDANRPTRLVFVFHGFGGNGNQIRSYLNLESQAAGQALFVYPDGVFIATYGGIAWANSDLAFFDAMVSEISQRYCIDSERIFAMGHSFGAYMTDLVGCERGNVVRAVAQISGGTQGGTCRGAVPAWLSHGTRDTVVPQSAGQQARDHWLTVNGCSSTSTPTAIPDCVTYDGCSAPVVWCSFAGGHYPPFPSYTNQAIWDFFSTH